MLANDLSGRRFGRLLVQRQAGQDDRGNYRWLALCDCGKSITPRGYSLTGGNTKSCGCLAREVSRKNALNLAKHGMSHTAIFRLWTGMMARCYSPSAANYASYGARGISVCERWRSFENFYADMGEPPAGKSLDRFPDTHGDYEPGNCRWATAIEQQRNKTNNRILEFDGRSMCLTAWADERGISRTCLDNRLRAGWSIADAITRPVPARYRRETMNNIERSLGIGA